MRRNRTGEVGEVLNRVYCWWLHGLPLVQVRRVVRIAEMSRQEFIHGHCPQRTTVMRPCSFVGEAVTPIPFSNRDNPELRCYAPVTHIPNCQAGKRLLECDLHKIAVALGRSSK